MKISEWITLGFAAVALTIIILQQMRLSAKTSKDVADEQDVEDFDPCLMMAWYLAGRMRGLAGDFVMPKMRHGVFSTSLYMAMAIGLEHGVLVAQGHAKDAAQPTLDELANQVRSLLDVEHDKRTAAIETAARALVAGIEISPDTTDPKGEAMRTKALALVADLEKARGPEPVASQVAKAFKAVTINVVTASKGDDGHAVGAAVEAALKKANASA